jgi:hypothetical protein
MASSEMLRRVALVRINVSDEYIFSNIKAINLLASNNVSSKSIEARCDTFLRNADSYKSHTA